MKTIVCLKEDHFTVEKPIVVLLLTYVDEFMSQCMMEELWIVSKDLHDKGVCTDKEEMLYSSLNPQEL